MSIDFSDKKPPLHLHCRCMLTVMGAIISGNATNNGDNGADYRLKHNGCLPSYYISKPQLEELGWSDGERPSKYVDGKMLGGGVYDNENRSLPHKPGRVWYEADINYTPGRRNSHRIVWSNDGLIFVTYDHYRTFYEIV